MLRPSGAPTVVYWAALSVSDLVVDWAVDLVDWKQVIRVQVEGRKEGRKDGIRIGKVWARSGLKGGISIQQCRYPVGCRDGCEEG